MRRASLLCVLAGCGSEPPPPCGPLPEPAVQPFVDATASLGLDAEHHFATDFCALTDTIGGPGVCLLDHDGDGDLDVYLPDRAPHPNRLFRNDGAAFTDVTDASGAGSTSDTMGCLAFDADGDRDLDLYLANVGRDRLLRNDGGTFVDATDAFGLEEDGFSLSASAGDVDADGDLDVFVARPVKLETCPDACFLFPLACEAESNLLLENRGGSFVDVAAERGITELEPTLVALMFDADVDGDVDIYAGNDMGIAFSDRLYVNDGTGRFADDAPNLGFDVPGSDTMGIDLGDYDRDGRLDAVVTDFEDRPIRILRCFDPELPCSNEIVPDGLDTIKWSAGFVDFDQDGALDLFVATGHVAELDGQANHLYWGDGYGRFAEHHPGEGEALALAQTSRGAAFGDLDGDGDVDVVVANAGGAPQVLLNQAPVGRGLTVALDPPLAGAYVEVTTEHARYVEQSLVGAGYASSGDPRVHFGIAEACRADVTVRWPGGGETSASGVASDGVVTIAR